MRLLRRFAIWLRLAVAFAAPMQVMTLLLHTGV
jgi:hypothetical protein